MSAYMASRLKGVAVVTGAGSGIGQAVAKAVVASGVSHIALLDINIDGLTETESQLLQSAFDPAKPPTVQKYTIDVSSPESIEKTYTDIHKKFGRIDYSIHSAGIVIVANSVNLSIEDFDKQININYRGLWLCQRAALKVMQSQSLNSEAYPSANIPTPRAQRGAIVNISSTTAIAHVAQKPAYCSSKAAVTALTRSDALDFAGDAIRVNAVVPGLIMTPMMGSSAELEEAVEKRIIKPTPLKQAGSPEEVADVVVFLCGVGASFVTGAAWVVDGGYTLT